jgi:hypothetical protein
MLAFAAAALVLVSCGSKSSPTTAAPPATTAVPTATSTASGPGALQAEVAATAAGDIPDNQVFVTYRGSAFSMKFPEGWAQAGAGTNVTFRDKNNIVRIVILRGTRPPQVKGATITARPAPVTEGGLHGTKLTYRTTSAPNPVTGKHVTLTVDRYALAKGGRMAIIDLGTPVGVDNVDAYRMMVGSFRIR